MKIPWIYRSRSEWTQILDTMTWVASDYSSSILLPLPPKPQCNIHCKITAIAALVVFKKFRRVLEGMTNSFYCNAYRPKYRISYLIRRFFFLYPPRKLSPQIILQLITRKNCRLLNPQKYLTNYRVHLITCGVLWGRKYGKHCMLRACDHSVLCLITMIKQLALCHSWEFIGYLEDFCCFLQLFQAGHMILP